MDFAVGNQQSAIQSINFRLQIRKKCYIILGDGFYSIEHGGRVVKASDLSFQKKNITWAMPARVRTSSMLLKILFCGFFDLGNETDWGNLSTVNFYCKGCMWGKRVEICPGLRGLQRICFEGLLSDCLLRPFSRGG